MLSTATPSLGRCSFSKSISQMVFIAFGSDLRTSQNLLSQFPHYRAKKRSWHFHLPFPWGGHNHHPCSVPSRKQLQMSPTHACAGTINLRHTAWTQWQILNHQLTEGRNPSLQMQASLPLLRTTHCCHSLHVASTLWTSLLTTSLVQHKAAPNTSTTSAG